MSGSRTLNPATAYFGRTLGSPPGLPGGGITGVLAALSGVGARISGSTPDGGHSTPSDFASLSPSGSLDWPTVAPDPTDPFGEQLAAVGAGGGAVACGGVAGAGGAWAAAALAIRHIAQLKNHEDVIRMERKRIAGASVPGKTRRAVHDLR
jgi:hypothetical protein